MFYYEADRVNRVLYLQDKNRGARNAENREFAANSEVTAQTRSARKGRKPADKVQAVRDSIEAVNFIPKAALASIGPEDPKINPIACSTRRTKGIRAESKPTKRNRMILNYTVQNGGQRVILRGINERKDSIYVVLNRYERPYALSKSTLNAGTYE